MTERERIEAEIIGDNRIGCQDESCEWNMVVDGGCWCGKLGITVGVDGRCLDRKAKE